jgi:ParB/RepB/Spo0J family partition protein
MENKHNIEYIKTSVLKEAEYNPRQMTKKQAEDLKASIKKFGLVDPIIVNKHPRREDIVIGGHQRLKIAAQLGIDTVPVLYLDLDEEQEKELNLRLNKNTGEWDFDALSAFDSNLLLTIGFSDEELISIFQLDLKEEDPKEKEVDENIETDNRCPKCGYEW